MERGDDREMRLRKVDDEGMRRRMEERWRMFVVEG